MSFRARQVVCPSSHILAVCLTLFLLLPVGGRVGVCLSAILCAAAATSLAVVVAEFGDAYPELREKEGFVVGIIKEEEEAFSSMLVGLILC